MAYNFHTRAFLERWDLSRESSPSTWTCKDVSELGADPGQPMVAPIHNIIKG